MKNPSTISSGESDERAAFEAHMRRTFPGVELALGNDGVYRIWRVENDWMLWQARAALATQPAESKACASVGVQPDVPMGYKAVLVPDEPAPAEPDWEECIRQAEVSTGIKVERNTFKPIRLTWRDIEAAEEFDQSEIPKATLIAWGKMFEAWAVSNLYPRGPGVIKLNDWNHEGGYAFTATSDAWKGFQAGAALTPPAPAAAPQAGEPVTWQKKHATETEGVWETCGENDFIFWASRPGWETRALYATPPAAPAATEAPSKPFAYYIHIAAEQRGEFVCDLDEALDDLTNCECKITELFDRATPAPAVGASPADPLRVACVTLDGSTLTVPVAQLGDVLHGEDDQHTYTLTLKTMTRAEFEALGEFNGF